MQPATESEKADLRAALANLGIGHFATDTIHRQHVALVRAEDREPMHPIRLGQVLTEYGAIRKPKWDGTKRRKDGKRPGFMVKGWIV